MSDPEIENPKVEIKQAESITEVERLIAQRSGLVDRVSRLTTEVRHGKKVTRWDLTQAEKALSILDQQIARERQVASGKPRVKRTQFRVGKGY